MRIGRSRKAKIGSLEPPEADLVTDRLPRSPRLTLPPPAHRNVNSTHALKLVIWLRPLWHRPTLRQSRRSRWRRNSGPSAGLAQSQHHQQHVHHGDVIGPMSRLLATTTSAISVLASVWNAVTAAGTPLTCCTARRMAPVAAALL